MPVWYGVILYLLNTAKLPPRVGKSFRLSTFPRLFPSGRRGGLFRQKKVGVVTSFKAKEKQYTATHLLPSKSHNCQCFTADLQPRTFHPAPCTLHPSISPNSQLPFPYPHLNPARSPWASNKKNRPSQAVSSVP